MPDPMNPQTLNRYSYCLNNPLKYIDPSGHFPAEEIFRRIWEGRGGDGGGDGGWSGLKEKLKQSPVCLNNDYMLRSIDSFFKSPEETLDELQMALDAFGMFPGIGEPLDAINALISVGRGDLVEAAFSIGAIVPVAGSGVTGLKWGYKAGKQFGTFNQLKKAIGDPGEKKVWHHVVEQCQIEKSGFDPEMIHNIDNVLAVDAVKHAKISGYFNSIDINVSSSMRVRDWLAGQPLARQYEFGIAILKKFGY